MISLFLIYVLIGWGITDFLVNGSILDRIRTYFLVKIPFFYKLLSCVRCSGFWVGVGMAALILFQIFLPLFNMGLGFILVTLVFSGFLVSGSSVLINALMIYLLTRNSKRSRRS